MRAIVTAVVAAIEGCAAAVASLAVIAIPAVLLWVVTFGIAAEPQDVAASVAGVWLLAHLVPMQFNLPQETMLSMGLGPEPLAFTLSIAPLAVTLITVAFAVRAGLRLSRRGGRGAAGLVGGALGFAVVALGVVAISDEYTSWPVAGAVATPTLVYLVAAGAAFVIAAALSGEYWWGLCVRGMQRGIEYLGVHGGVAAFPARAASVMRLAAGSLSAVVGIAAIGVAVALAVGFASVTALAQALQLDALGSVLLFLAQLALLPTGVIWAVAWLSGAGFEAGGAFSPFADGASALPTLPMLGALPSDWGSFGAIAPTLLVLANLAVGLLLAQHADLRRVSWAVALLLPVLAAAATGLAAAGLSALGSGSMGPGRLEIAGPDPWMVGGLVACEAAVGLVLGVTAARLDYSRVQAMLPEPIARWNAERATRAEHSATVAVGEVNPEDAETVDLSQVRDELGDDADDLNAPVIDLFEGVLHAPSQQPIDTAPDEATPGQPAYGGDEADGWGTAAEADPELEVTEAASDAVTAEIESAALHFEAEAFDIEAMRDTGEVPEASDQADASAGGALEDPDEIERAFAWDPSAVAPSETANRGDDEAPGAGLRGRFGLRNWRGPRQKG